MKKKTKGLLFLLAALVLTVGIIISIPHNYHLAASDVVKVTLLPRHPSEQAVELTGREEINAFCEPFFRELSSLNAHYNPIRNMQSTTQGGIAYNVVIETSDGKTTTFTVSTINNRINKDDGVFLHADTKIFNRLDALLDGCYPDQFGAPLDEPNDLSMDTMPPTSDLPYEYPSGIAIENGDYVNIHGIIANEDAMADFLAKVDNKETASVRTVIYTVEGDPIITTFSFNSSYFSVTTDTTRDKFGAQAIENRRYNNLVLYTDEETERTYYIVTDLSEVNKEIYYDGFDGVVLKSE